MSLFTYSSYLNSLQQAHEIMIKFRSKTNEKIADDHSDQAVILIDNDQTP